MKTQRSWIRCLATLVVVSLGTVTAQAHNTSAETTNKKLVIDFYTALEQASAEGKMKEKSPAIAEKYIHPQYTQHSEMYARFGTGRDGFVKAMQSQPDRSGPAPASPPVSSKPFEPLAIMAEGDRVMMLIGRQMSASAPTVYIFNMFRVQDGKLAEHWDVMPAMGAPPGQGAPGGAGGPPTAR